MKRVVSAPATIGKKARQGLKMKRIFVVGPGRSGTHFLARLLNGYDNTIDPYDGNENSRILRSSSRSAIWHRRISPSILNEYRQDFGPLIRIDQHHPNLFHACELSKALPGSVFVYIRRPLVQIVASMIAHPGIATLYSKSSKWHSFIPFPNQFFGVRSKQEFLSLPKHKLYAFRVLAHKYAFTSLYGRMQSEKLKTIYYESLVQDPEKELSYIFSKEEKNRLGRLSIEMATEKLSLSKYKSELTQSEIDELELMEDKSDWRGGHF